VEKLIPLSNIYRRGPALTPYSTMSVITLKVREEVNGSVVLVCIPLLGSKLECDFNKFQAMSVEELRKFGFRDAKDLKIEHLTETTRDCILKICQRISVTKITLLERIDVNNLSNMCKHALNLFDPPAVGEVCVNFYIANYNEMGVFFDEIRKQNCARTSTSTNKKNKILTVALHNDVRDENGNRKPDTEVFDIIDKLITEWRLNNKVGNE